MLERCADIKAKDDDGDTPLKIAIQCGANKLVQFLLDHGATPEPGEYAEAGSNDDLVQ